MSALVRPTQSSAAAALIQATAEKQQHQPGELGLDSHHQSTHPSENDSGVLLIGKAASNNEDEGDVEKLAEKETRNVRLWKLVVDVIILLAGAAVAVFTYQSLAKGEEEDYETAVRKIWGILEIICCFFKKHYTHC